jgi:hypothetical protein
MLSNYITSLIRTAVPGVVGWLLSLPFAAAICHATGIDTPTATRYLSAGVAFGLAFAYYAIARALEQKFPQLGVLLGKPVQPSYSATAKDFDVPATPDPLEPAPVVGPVTAPQAQAVATETPTQTPTTGA